MSCKSVLISFFAIACYFNDALAVQRTPIDSLEFLIPEKTKQIMLVTSGGWNAVQGQLQRYENEGGKWKLVGAGIPVVVGRNGLAWGKGLHQSDKQSQKREGDSKAPAGVFSLGTMFGYGSQSPSKLGFPYRQSTVRDYFVDDVNSADYNTWVTIPESKENNPKALWGSVEKMKRGDHLYEYGIVINHNSAPAEKGKGSAIFFHVWRTPTTGTLGCTAMSKENLLALMGWLDPSKSPLLIQAPKKELAQLK